MAHHLYQGFALIGSIWSTYHAVRIGATGRCLSAVEERRLGGLRSSGRVPTKRPRPDHPVGPIRSLACVVV